ncbi:Upstream activation factor subunit [Seminavis robusta]|uniref:Upstream activation factor subunit n=1 Tax=Seminavis robusta TaxID=568900 RepID=A0A9N8ERF1_9STRA|nr:Upstream activation factor subunit [Seminavis robusta]|eukprot:Sro1497_g277650.1 Upstream activation factor subunit (288) ;mRNA; r:26915-27778
MASPSHDDEDEELSDATIQSAIDELLPKVDLATTGVKKFRKLLSKHLGGMDLTSRTKFITAALTKAINDMEDNESDEEASSSEDEAPQKTVKKKKGGLQAPKELSPKLAKFLHASELSRPQIVKGLWDYIKEHDLQNPDNRKEILLDAKMKKVFGCDKFTMFSMNKYISHHCHPFPPLDLSSKSKKTPPKRKASSKDDKSGKKKQKGTQPPWRLSDALADVLGVDTCARPQVVSKLWDYIKANELQNPNDKREILCNDKLKKIFDNHQTVTMFSMNKFISKHLLEKV